VIDVVAVEGEAGASAIWSSLPIEWRLRCLVSGLTDNVTVGVFDALALNDSDADDADEVDDAEDDADGVPLVGLASTQSEPPPPLTSDVRVKATKISPAIGPSDVSPRPRSGIQSLNCPLRCASSSCTVC
jgi:hypothetical protein